VTTTHLGRVQQRRQLPTRLTQLIQVLIQDRVISRVLASRRQFSLPLPLRLLRRLPMLQRIPAYLIGMGIRPEHVRSGASKAVAESP
jgi:hypothetical protein